jgi:hypothetical protein
MLTPSQTRSRRPRPTFAQFDVVVGGLVVVGGFVVCGGVWSRLGSWGASRSREVCDGCGEVSVELGGGAESVRAVWSAVGGAAGRGGRRGTVAFGYPSPPGVVVLGSVFASEPGPVVAVGSVEVPMVRLVVVSTLVPVSAVLVSAGSPGAAMVELTPLADPSCTTSYFS